MTNCCCGFVCNPPERGANNIAANPCFYDWGTGFGTNNIGTDFRIRRVSPCVNAGLDQLWMSGAHDLAGNRRQCGTVDMGAYEYRLPQGTMLIFRGN